MATPSYTVHCTKKLLVAPGVYELRFAKPQNFSFLAGQFILFDVPLVADRTNIQPRAYSLASAPDEDDLLFVVKIKEGGRFSEWMTKELHEGSAMTMKGPFGLFTLKESDRPIIFAATGAGLAPFRSHILDSLKQSTSRQLDLFFGVRHEKDLFWREELESLARNNKNLRVHLCLSGDNPEWTGNNGRIQSFIPQIIKNPEETEIYICGAPAMVTDIKKLAMEQWKMPKANVHGEGYI